MLHLTAKNFDSEVKHESLPVVVMFYAVWCGKCAMMKPIAEDAEKKYRRKIKFCEVEIEESDLLAAEYDTEIVPTFICFKEGRIVGAMRGIIDEDVFYDRIQKIFRNS
ncbi:thioredoxin family protein [Extibacter muris]|uniref:thioredoxin family protein n=1 Tax=Extibacter muris TaxID=1796622 RepID=UPI001D08B472|nr:thioredoxin domain-containing protein [Extibacter muris]MCB6201337.1 thioredoxin [Extibacter muris]MCQ4664596.1 thioredoxin [Extibacter muris]MCQ4693763.1 thioredoxin [Extibacter muris]